MSQLHDHERDELVRLAGLLDHAAGPLPATVLPPEPRLRTALEAMLARRGRVPVEVDVGEKMMWTTTAPADAIAEQLVAADVGVLDTTERAVLALVLLWCVALPTATGNPPAAWHLADRVPHSEIRRSKLPDAHVTAALRTLSYRQLVDAVPTGVKPGLALTRMTPTTRRRLEVALVDLVAGADPLIRRVLDRLEPQGSPRE